MENFIAIIMLICPVILMFLPFTKDQRFLDDYLKLKKILIKIENGKQFNEKTIDKIEKKTNDKKRSGKMDKVNYQMLKHMIEYTRAEIRNKDYVGKYYF